MRSSKPSDLPLLTVEQLAQARKLFQEYEPRDLVYRAATELVQLALDGKSNLTVAEALAVLLQTWNAQYYRFGRHTFDVAHFEAIDAVFSSYEEALRGFRNRHIISLESNELDEVEKIFTAFELVLGPVGTAKALHLLAPDFFPLWDRKIAGAYGLWLGSAGENGPLFSRFVTIVFEQVTGISGLTDVHGVLKWIDEFNYCRFTKGWI